MFNLTINTNAVSTLFTLVDTITNKRIVNQYVLNSKLAFKVDAATGRIAVSKKGVGQWIVLLRTPKAHEANGTVSWETLRTTGFAFLFHMPVPVAPVVVDAPKRARNAKGQFVKA